MAYTSISKVSALLNGVTIDGSSVPSSTVVNDWIAESDNEIDVRTGKVWSSSAVTDEILDYDGSGYLRLPDTPVTSITSLSYNLYPFGNTSSSWTALTEGRTEDFILNSDEGEIIFTDSTVPAGERRIKVSYVKGDATTPKWIERLSTLMTARNFIESVVLGSASNEGGSITVGNISISDPTTFSSQQIINIDNEIESLLNNKIDQSHVFRPKRQYSLRY